MPMRRPVQATEGNRSATIVPTLLLTLGCSALAALMAYGAAPSWWNSRGAVMTEQVVTNNGVVTTNYVPNNYAVVTQGQLKQFTARAVDELNADLTNNGGAGTALSNLVYGWQQDYATNGYATNTANPTRPYKPSDYTAINVGQLKYIASLVYGQLANAGYTGLYPSWIQPNSATDNTVANLGQLKEVFDFDLTVAANAVQNLTATAGANEIDLSWTLPPVNNATSFTVQESTDDGATWTSLATLTDPTTTSYAASDLSAGQSYSFQVVASNGVGSSAPTSTASPTVAHVGAPYVTATLGASNTVNLSWTEGSSSGVTGFTVQQSTDQGQTWTQVDAVGASATTDTLSHLSGAMDTSEFEVTAQAGSGTTASSAPVTPTASATTDTDGDKVNDNLDGWAGFTDPVQEAKLQPARLPNPTYVAVTISTIPNTYTIDFVNHQGQAVVHNVRTNPDGTQTNIYYFWDKGATMPVQIPIPANTAAQTVNLVATGLSDAGTVIGYNYWRGASNGDTLYGFWVQNLAWRWTSGMAQVQTLGDVDPFGAFPAAGDTSDWSDFETVPQFVSSSGPETIYGFHQHLAYTNSPRSLAVKGYAEKWQAPQYSPQIYYATDKVDYEYAINPSIGTSISSLNFATQGSHESRYPAGDNGQNVVIGSGCTMDTYVITPTTDTYLPQAGYDVNVVMPASVSVSSGNYHYLTGIFSNQPLEPLVTTNNSPVGGGMIVNNGTRYWINGSPSCVNSAGQVAGLAYASVATTASYLQGYPPIWPYSPTGTTTPTIWVPQTSNGNVTGYTPVTITMPQAGLSFTGNAGLYFNKNLQIIGGKSPPAVVPYAPYDAPFLWQNYQYHKLSDFFPGLSNYSAFQVRGLDDNSIITAIATPNPPAGSNAIQTQQIVQLCPVAVVSDPSNTYQVNNNNPVLTYVRFGLWDNAFSTINPPSPITTPLATPTLSNGNAESANFVGSDSRRFYLRVYDPSAIGNPATVQTVTADWFTRLPGGTMDDDGNLQEHPAGVDTVTLTETAAGSGIFASKALMLVSDDVDNAQPTNTGLPGASSAGVGIGVADHRLRRAALGDTMCYSYTPAAAGSIKSTFSLPIFGPAGSADVIKNITVHFVEAKATAPIYNNHAQMLLDVSAMESQMSARFAVAGINPNYIYNPATDVLDVTSTGVNLNAVDGGGGSSLPSGNLYLLAQALRAQYGAYTSSNTTIYVIVIGKFAGGAAGGESITDGVVAANPAEAPLQRCCFLAQLGGLNNPVAAPHELGHQLSDETTADLGTDNNHYDGLNLGQDMMYYAANDIPQLVTDSKRLWDDPVHADVVHQYQIDYMRQSPLCH